MSGPFVKFPEPFEGDDVTELIARYRDELPFSDQLPAFDPPEAHGPPPPADAAHHPTPQGERGVHVATTPTG